MSLEPPDDIRIRPAVISSPLDEAAYRRVVATQDRTYWPGWEETRLLSVRWGTRAQVTILIAVDGPSEPSETLDIVGTCEVIGPLDATSGGAGGLPRRCLLRDVWVTERRRRRGIARRLLGAAEELVRERGVSYVSLEVDGANEAALALYDAEGYVEAAGDSPADLLMSPLSSAIKRLPGWMRGTVVLCKDLGG